MNIVFFGDSITQGYWAVDHGWVDRVRKYYTELQLAENEYHGIYNLSVDGDVTEDIHKRIKSELQARIRPDHTVMPVVVIQVGINDSTEKEVDLTMSMDAYKKSLKGIVQEIDGLNSSIVFVGYPSSNEEKTTPVSWGDYYYTNEKAKAYETAMSEVADELDIIFVPVFDEFKRRTDSGENLLADGLHPNDDGHELIYEIVMPKLREILK